MSADLDTLTPPSPGSCARATLEELPRWKRRLELTVPPDRVREERRRRIQQYARRLKLPGFRPGRAPADLVHQRFRAEIESDLVRGVARDALSEAIAEHGLEPIGAPVLRSLDLDAGDTLHATAELEVRPRLELERIRGFTVERPAVAVAADAPDRVLERIRDERAELRPVDRPAALGDVVAIRVQPEAEPSADWRAHEIWLGSGQTDPDVEAGLQGSRAGDERVLAVRAPGEAGAEAEPRRYRVRVTEVKERISPALDDTFAARVSTSETLADLRRRIGENLREEASGRAEREVRDRLVDAIAEANQVEVPEAMVESYVERMLRPEPASGGPGANLRRRSASEHDRHAHAGHAHAGPAHDTRAGSHDPAHAHDRGDGPDAGGVPDREVREVLRPAAERSLRRHLIVEAVARAEDLEPTAEQLDAYLSSRLPEGTTLEEARRRLERTGQLEDLRHHLRDENVFAFLKSQSTIRAAEGSAPAEPAG